MPVPHLAMAGLTLTLALALPAAAQPTGTLDIGVFGRYTIPDRALGQQDARGFGARVGFFVVDNVALEVEHSVNFTEPLDLNEENRLRPYYLRLAIHHPAGVIVGTGWVRDRFDPFDAEPFDDDGFHFLLGLEQPMSRGVGVRIDATYDFLPSPITERPGRDISMSHWGLQAGLAFRIGGFTERRTLSDEDRDGVRDDLDQCPGTPMGARTDARGCPPQERT